MRRRAIGPRTEGGRGGARSACACLPVWPETRTSSLGPLRVGIGSTWGAQRRNQRPAAPCSRGRADRRNEKLDQGGGAKVFGVRSRDPIGLSRWSSVATQPSRHVFIALLWAAPRPTSIYSGHFTAHCTGLILVSSALRRRCVHGATTYPGPTIYPVFLLFCRATRSSQSDRSTGHAWTHAETGRPGWSTGRATVILWAAGLGGRFHVRRIGSRCGRCTKIYGIDILRTSGF